MKFHKGAATVERARLDQVRLDSAQDQTDTHRAV